MALDAFQQAAVDCDAAHIQIVGHPGTGKTLVMASRIARLLREGTPPEAVVALTFSNSARAALQARVAALAGAGAARVEINTFHAFCANLVSAHAGDVGLAADWRMADPLDMYNLLGDPRLALPLRHRARFPAGFAPRERERFRQRLAEDHAYDFDTALQLGCRIAAQRDLRIAHLLIDEFQDGQALQWELVRSIARVNPRLRVCVVGDANQEIFAFRADHLRDAFGVMRATFPDTAVLDLRYNYRSTPQIIAAFEPLVPRTAAHRPNLIATRARGAEPELRVYATPAQELAALGALVAQQLRAYAPHDVAVLVPYNRDVLAVRQALAQRGIAATNALNVRALSAQALPNLALSLLKWAKDPRDLYLAQLLYSKHHRFVSEADLAHLPAAPSLGAALARSSKYAGHAFLAETLPRLRAALLACRSVRELVACMAAAVESWRQLCAGGRGGVRRRRAAPPAAWLEFKRALASIELPPDALAPAPAPATDEAPSPVLRALLRHVFQHGELAAAGRVHVRTMHSAKSREWPCVIVAGRAQAAAPRAAPDAAREDDERRLLYVAASRAQERLFFTSGGGVADAGLMRFLRPGVPQRGLMPAAAARLYPKQYMRVLARSSLGRRLVL